MSKYQAVGRTGTPPTSTLILVCLPPILTPVLGVCRMLEVT